ncbi:trypsin-like peptidase domain-containing protein [Candidatus Peregrinibacteria bacterium]|nr:trypsin-like peptidase domain-containing protein [Candidatus Peregrinibacteria bacterium]
MIEVKMRISPFFIIPYLYFMDTHNLAWKNKKIKVSMLAAWLIAGSILIVSLYALIPLTEAENTEPRNFSTASPTIKIVAYKLAYAGNILKTQSGSGTIIQSDGMILTNNHVISDNDQKPLDAFEVCVTFEMNQAPVCDYSASLMAQNTELDLALLKIDATDIEGNTVENLAFLDANKEIDLQTGAALTIVGYPDTGQDTITTTKGQVSGFSKENGHQYIKTDASVSFGNSGGTALDEQGNFVGVPSYVLSELGNLGYVLDIREARDWMKEHLDDKAITQEKAQKAMRSQMKLWNDTIKTRTFTYPSYPKFTIGTPEGWNFEEINEKFIRMRSQSGGKFSYITIEATLLPFKVNDAFLEKLFKGMDFANAFVTSYKREKTTLNGYPAHLVRLSYSDYESKAYFIPYGHALISIYFNMDLQSKEASTKSYEEVLKTFHINSKTVDNPAVKKTMSFDNPPFSLTQMDGWYMMPNQKSVFDPNAILEITRSDSFDGVMEVFYEKWTESERELNNRELFETTMKEYKLNDYRQVLAKNETLVVDGLEGWSVTTSFPGEGTEIRKKSEVYLSDGDHYFYITYEDKDTNYDTYVEDFRNILLHFRNLKNKEPGLYEIGALNSSFKDISYHRYESEISYLKERGYLESMTGDEFRPENALTRAEILKLLVEAKIRFEEESKNLGKHDDALWGELDSYSKKVSRTENFKDTTKDAWYAKYIRYGKKKGFVSGYQNGSFRPNHKSTTAETLSMMFRIFDLKVWKAGNGVEWYEPLMDKGYEKHILPYGLYDPHHAVTKAEFAYMLKNLLNEVDSFNFFMNEGY